MRKFKRLISEVDAESGFTPKSHKAERVPNFAVKGVTNPERLFNALQADSFIQKVAQRDENGALEIEKTADFLGIPLVYGTTHSPVIRASILGTGLYKSPSELKIIISTDYDYKEHAAMSFGHEIGHYFLDDVTRTSHTLSRNDNERFCDYFGAMMVLGAEQLEKVDFIDEGILLNLMKVHRVDITSLIIQLIRHRKLPTCVAIDTQMPPTDNIEYRDKAGRVYICYYCYVSEGNVECPNKHSDGAHFDFTDKVWWQKMEHCQTDKTFYDYSFIEKLTEYYKGRLGQLALFTVNLEPNVSV